MRKNNILVLVEIATATGKRNQISIWMCLQGSNGNMIVHARLKLLQLKSTK